MKKHRVDYSLVSMSHCFNVSRSGYYAWLQRKLSQLLLQRQLLDEQVKLMFYQHSNVMVRKGCNGK